MAILKLAILIWKSRLLWVTLHLFCITISDFLHLLSRGSLSSPKLNVYHGNVYFTQHILGSQREKQHRQRKCRKFDTFNFNTEQMKSCPQKPALLNLRITIETQLRPFKLSTLSFSAIGGGRSISPSQFSLMLNNALIKGSLSGHYLYQQFQLALHACINGLLKYTGCSLFLKSA